MLKANLATWEALDTARQGDTLKWDWACSLGNNQFRRPRSGWTLRSYLGQQSPGSLIGFRQTLQREIDDFHKTSSSPGDVPAGLFTPLEHYFVFTVGLFYCSPASYKVEWRAMLLTWRWCGKELREIGRCCLNEREDYCCKEEVDERWRRTIITEVAGSRPLLIMKLDDLSSLLYCFLKNVWAPRTLLRPGWEHLNPHLLQEHTGGLGVNHLSRPWWGMIERA